SYPLRDRLGGLLDDLLFDVDAIGDAVFEIQIRIVTAPRQGSRKQLVDIAVGERIPIEEKPDCICAYLVLRRGCCPVTNFFPALFAKAAGLRTRVRLPTLSASPSATCVFLTTETLCSP